MALKIQGGNKVGSGASLRQSKRQMESVFGTEEYAAFDAKLRTETEMARGWGELKKYATMSPLTLGCEVESCLTDSTGCPTPEAATFLEYFSSNNGYHEMAKFNVEFEISPVEINGTAFTEMYETLENNRLHTARCADMVDAHVMLFGILPSLRAADFSSDMISDRLHFRTLEKQLRALNKDRPFVVNIGYGDGLRFDADNLSIEGAATSLQVHLGVSEPKSAAFYNAAQMISAIMVGVCANSPFFMGKRLWAETRIPLFEQIMYERFVGQNAQPLSFGRQCNDIFGNGYLKNSLVELFTDNYENMSAVLPIVRETPPEKMLHLILHNRDILRWNRPVIGFIGDKPFLRIEHRAIPSGPTTADMTANMALFVGLVYHFHHAFTGATAEKTISHMPFETVRENFYRAARDGLSAEIFWLGNHHNLRSFVLEKGLEYAKRGLRAAGVEEYEIAQWLTIIEERVSSSQNGSAWQQRYVAKNGNDEQSMREMVRVYWQNQEGGVPVHRWQV